MTATEAAATSRKAPRRKQNATQNAPRVVEHVSEAELRATAQREPDHASPRVRKRKSGVYQEDMFFIPRDQIPEGLDYEWKRYSVSGLEDPFYIARMRNDGGWEPVPAARHPDWVPPGYKDPYIIKGGQILMDRPMPLTIEAKQESLALARRQIREAEQRLGKAPDGTMTRDFDGARPKLVKEVGRMVPLAVES